MIRAHRRWIAVVLLALLAFGQAGIVMAGCVMERGEVAAVVAGKPAHECCDEASQSMPVNACVTQAADLQAGTFPVSAEPAPGLAYVVVALPAEEPRRVAITASRSPPRSVPRRIFLHSFLI